MRAYLRETYYHGWVVAAIALGTFGLGLLVGQVAT